MSSETYLWIAFGVLVLLLLGLDLRVFQRKAHVIGVREALLWFGFWISMALLFNLVIYLVLGSHKALQFLTGYLIEESLSIDNLFVFLIIFAYFAVPARFQHRALYWGVIGALVMRLVFVLSGIALVRAFDWVFYIFGAFLIITAVRMGMQGQRKIEPEKNPVLRLARRVLPVSDDYAEGKFFIRKLGQTLVTPLFIVVLVIETTDVVFALDSIPAILGITVDPFIVYSSNIFAILGLRAIFFALAGVIRLFGYLSYGLVVILFFVGVKMLIAEVYEIPIVVSLGVVAGVISLSVLLSILRNRLAAAHAAANASSPEHPEHLPGGRVEDGKR